MTAPYLIKEIEAAELCGVSVQFLQRDRMKMSVGNRRGPPWYKLGGSVRYKAEDCVTWRESRRMASVNEISKS